MEEKLLFRRDAGVASKMNRVEYNYDSDTSSDEDEYSDLEDEEYSDEEEEYSDEEEEYSGEEEEYSGEEEEYSGEEEEYSDEESEEEESSDDEEECVKIVDVAHPWSQYKTVFNTLPSFRLSNHVSWSFSNANLRTPVRYVQLSEESYEYETVHAHFKSHSKKSKFTVHEINRVENIALSGMYQLKRSELMSRHGAVDERFLYHGTTSANIDAICEENLDWRLHGSGTGHKFGRGVSFSPLATYASYYCDRKPPIKEMLMFLVLVGPKCHGDGDMDLPPVHKRTNRGVAVPYDASTKPNGDVIVKYNDDEFYPLYRITFEVPRNYSRWHGKKK